MKQLAVYQSNYAQIFGDTNNEPLILKNTTGKQFLMLPLENMNWQTLFLYLHQIPKGLVEDRINEEKDLDIVEKLYGSMKGRLSSSEEFARRKQEEIELEERKWNR